jgi:23S rRNA (adenine2503-C2)-methyltransferase
MPSPNIRHLEFDQLADAFTKLGYPKFRARQVYEWLWHHGASSFGQMTSLPAGLRQSLEEHYSIDAAVVQEKQESRDGTIKYLFRLFDGHLVEAVLIPSADRITLCISTQVGCSLGCGFCATGRMGFKRDLHFDEIFDQVACCNKESLELYNKQVTNIVYMGMGEPLLNYANTIRSVRKICAPTGLGFSPQRITISTAGIADKIKQLADDRLNINLAISLNAPSDTIRTKLMPINKKYNLKSLKEAIRHFNNQNKSIVTLEYIVLSGVNDSVLDVRMLKEFSRGISIKFNLIELNKIEGSTFTSPDPKDIKAFKTRLEENNFIVNIRRSKGRDIDAACGQLATKSKKSK